MKPGDRVYWPSHDKHGTVRTIIEGNEWPKPYAWVDLDDGDYRDIECRHLRPVSQQASVEKSK